MRNFNFSVKNNISNFDEYTYVLSNLTNSPNSTIYLFLAFGLKTYKEHGSLLRLLIAHYVF